MDEEQDILDGFDIIERMEQARLSFASKYRLGSTPWRIALKSSEHVIKVLKQMIPHDEL